MRSAFAGAAALFVFAVLQLLAKSLLADVLSGGGVARDVISVAVLGATFGTFIYVYAARPYLRFMCSTRGDRKRGSRHRH